MLCGVETCDMRLTERRAYVVEIKCGGSIMGMTCKGRVNGCLERDLAIRIERDLARRVDERVFGRFCT